MACRYTVWTHVLSRSARRRRSGGDTAFELVGQSMTTPTLRQAKAVAGKRLRKLKSAEAYVFIAQHCTGKVTGGQATSYFECYKVAGKVTGCRRTRRSHVPTDVELRRRLGKD